MLYETQITFFVQHHGLQDVQQSRQKRRYNRRLLRGRICRGGVHEAADELQPSRYAAQALQFPFYTRSTTRKRDGNEAQADTETRHEKSTHCPLLGHALDEGQGNFRRSFASKESGNAC